MTASEHPIRATSAGYPISGILCPDPVRILVLSKRRYTGKDLLSERYGRLWEIPAELSGVGHEVRGVVAAYRAECAASKVGWLSARSAPHPLMLGHAWRTSLGVFRPDVIWASSDAAHLIAAMRLGSDWRVPVVLDHYDDYEAFGLTRWTGLTRRLREATAAAAAVTAVGHRLRSTLIERGARPDRVHVIPNGVPEAFDPAISRDEARRRLGLPRDAPLFGTAGALDESRGIGDLGRAAMHLADEARLVIAGPGSRAALGALPEGAIDLGVLPHADVAVLFRALDVGVVCNRETPFGRHCHPMKLVEMSACGLPVVATAVGEAALLLAGTPEALYPAGDAQALAVRVRAVLRGTASQRPSLATPWQVLARDVEHVLESAIESGRR